MAAMVVVISLGMVSCVDNIDNSTTPSDKEQQEQQAQDAKQEKSQKFWAVVSQLVDVDDYTDDYEGKTFEPTYGVAQGDDGTRYVFTNTAAAAAARFADLVERDDIDENTETYTYDDPDVGTLTYTKGGRGHQADSHAEKDRLRARCLRQRQFLRQGLLPLRRRGSPQGGQRYGVLDLRAPVVRDGRQGRLALGMPELAAREERLALP